MSGSRSKRETGETCVAIAKKRYGIDSYAVSLSVEISDNEKWKTEKNG